MHVLVVEDEPRMAGLLAQGLAEEGHHATVASNGVDGLSMAVANAFDIIVLDLMLPRIDGLEVARRLRAGRNRTPILMLTARDGDRDIVQGLDAGADDYLTKPFSFDVFLARLRAVSRRGPEVRPIRYQIGDLTVDTSTRDVYRAGVFVELTRREYSLLELLAKRSPRVIARNAILQDVWGFGGDVSENNLEAFIYRLRTKLGDGGDARLIHTVRGVGYCLRKTTHS